MKIHIDILTPKQSMLFSKLSERMTKEGHEVLKTTRDYREVVQLLSLRGVEARVVGRHGGRRLFDKLMANTERILKLAPLIEEWSPDLSVSFSSPEAARVAFGLGVPHFCVNDSPHAEAVARITVPISKLLFAPEVLPKKVWMRFGISADNIIQYNALDAWAWLKDFEPDKDVLTQLGLDASKPIITFRTEETFASYLLGKAPKKSVVIPLIEKIVEKPDGLQVVVIPRYREQIEGVKRALEGKAIVCESVVDGSSLLYFSSIFVGAGGTMTAEAALQGTPTFSLYPDEPYLIERYLIDRGLVIREADPARTLKRIMGVLDDLEQSKAKQKEKASRLTEDFEDPIEVIARTIEEEIRI